MYLNNHTYFSLRYGVMSPAELLATARSMGISTLALTDINNTSAALEFVRLAPQYHIKPVLGIDFRNGVEQQFVALARNNHGFMALNRFLSEYLHRQRPFPAQAPGLRHSYIIYPFGKHPPHLRPNEYIGIGLDDLPRLRLRQATTPLHKLVILQPVTFRHQRDFNIHRLLRAIDLNTLLSKVPPQACGRPQHRPVAPEKLLEAFGEFPEALYNTRQLLDNCQVYFEFGEQYPHKNQRTYTGSARKDFALLKKLCYRALPERYRQPAPRIYVRLEKELAVIRQKDAVAYFLINWDIVSYARSKGYFYVGRGSGANSLVAYLLRITDVDPIDLDLYFERFINLYRKNPPDFDIDFAHTDRDDVIAYIFRRFKHVALLATYNTFQQRAAVRELGKVFGLPPHEIARLSGSTPPAHPDKITRLVLRYAGLISGFPSHLSVHAGGIIITEKPIHYYTATFLPPKGFATSHIDMEIAEDAGIHKFDILSQRGLGKIREALHIISRLDKQTGAIDIHDMEKLKQDEAIKQLLRTGRTIGCFYIESPAMRMLLQKLAVDNYTGLVAASSIIRPGVAKSGMMREYILRYRHPEEVKKRAHPVLLDIMPDTYGVMVYQEDVIKVAHYFAGLSLQEADHLRRGMSGKFRSRAEFQKTRDSFFSNCRARGIAPAEAQEVWRQIESFAGYAFAKGHSASYAVESYQCLYLKAHYPLAYMVAVLNNGGGFYNTETYVHELRQCGALVEAPCLNSSELTAILHGRTVWLGLGMIAGLERQVLEQLLQERQRHGHYRSLADLTERVPLTLEQLKPLIRVGALRFTGHSKKALLWEAHLLLSGSRQTAPAGLFKAPTRPLALPAFNHTLREDARDEIELLGFPLCSPFELVEAPPDKGITAKQMGGHVGSKIQIAGYFVHRKKVVTSRKQLMYFGTFRDKEGAFFETVHFPDSARQYPFRGPGVYWLQGRVTEEFGCLSLEVEVMEKLAMVWEEEGEEALKPAIRRPG